MKKILLLFVITLAFFSCQKEDIKSENSATSKLDKNGTILKTWNIENSSKSNPFEIIVRGKMLLVYMELNKNVISLIDATSREVITQNTTIIPQGPITTLPLTCEQQADLQWQYYREVLYPRVLALANSNCTARLVCFGITCDGVAVNSYTLLVSPNSRNCQIANPN